MMAAVPTAWDPTRESLHMVAEHVLAAAEHAETGQIRLKYVPGGFETLDPMPGDRRLGVVEGRLTIMDTAGLRSEALTTLRAAARAVGIAAGLSPSVYPPATELSPDRPLTISPEVVTLIADWFGTGDEALRLFADRIGSGPVQPVLWPEHFDLAITIDGVNYGASPGDAHVDDPYLYVGPHSGPPRRDDFWNAEFGAVATIHQIASVDAAVAFFLLGRNRIADDVN
jgi:hypothetical protein